MRTYFAYYAALTGIHASYRNRSLQKRLWIQAGKKGRVNPRTGRVVTDQEELTKLQGDSAKANSKRPAKPSQSSKKPPAKKGKVGDIFTPIELSDSDDGLLPLNTLASMANSSGGFNRKEAAKIKDKSRYEPFLQLIIIPILIIYI